MTLPSTVIFDVDGTLVDSERDGHRVAFNRAFEELGLTDRWDEELYGQLLAVTGGQRRLHAYFSSKGRPQAERDDLVPRLHQRKNELFFELIDQGEIRPRPGVTRLLDELEDAGVVLSVATTGSRSWVERLLDRLFGLDRFAVVMTGDEVDRRKPEPEVYHQTLQALARLGHQDLRARAVAIEDSANGLAAARSAGLPCVIVVNDYTADQDFRHADLVVDSLGVDGAPGTALHDPHGLGHTGPITPSILGRLVDARSAATQHP